MGRPVPLSRTAGCGPGHRVPAAHGAGGGAVEAGIGEATHLEEADGGGQARLVAERHVAAQAQIAAARVLGEPGVEVQVDRQAAERGRAADPELPVPVLQRVGASVEQGLMATHDVAEAHAADQARREDERGQERAEREAREAAAREALAKAAQSGDAPDFDLAAGQFERPRVDLAYEPDTGGEIVEWTSAAAEYLHGRDWQGLEVRRGETEVHVAAEGRTGVASGYAEEPDVDD